MRKQTKWSAVLCCGDQEEDGNEKQKEKKEFGRTL